MKALRISAKPLRPRASLHATVAAHIGSLIVRGEVSEGAILPNESSLGAQLGVSRTALREGIKVLASKGLVETRRKTGTRVTGKDCWNMLDPEVLGWISSGAGVPASLEDLMEVRMLVEPAAAKMAARRATPNDLKLIRQAFERMEGSRANVSSSIEADLQFHMAVLQGAHNVFMRPFGALIQAALRASFNLTSSNKQLYELTLPLHRRVLEAIESGSYLEAEAAMTKVLTKTAKDIQQQSEATPKPRKGVSLSKK